MADRTSTRVGAAVFVKVENLLEADVGTPGTGQDKTLQVRDAETKQVIHRGHWYEDHMLQYFQEDGSPVEGVEIWMEAETPVWYQMMQEGLRA